MPRDGPRGIDAADLLRSLSDFSKRLDRIGRVVGENRRVISGTSASVESNSLGLETIATPTALTSTEEVNSTPTSYTPSDPDFAGGSSSQATLSGTCTGGADDTYSFVATSGGIVGVSAITFEVRDGSGGVVDTVNFAALQAPGVEESTNFGISLALSSGSVVLGDSFDVDVSASVGSAVDPDGAFNVAGTSGANFESGFAVGAGAFEINGVGISVAADDTITRVLSSIKQSAAGVQATFDAATESVTLTSTATGSSSQVVVESDSSGFLAAVKLSGAVATGGRDDERLARLTDVTAFSGVAAGSFEVNGTTIAVDPTADSLDDVLTRIGTLADGVTARYDTALDRVVLDSEGATGSISLSGDTSGLLQALSISEGEVTGDLRVDRVTGFSRRNFRDNAGDLDEIFNDLFSTDAAGSARLEQIRIRSEIGGALTRLFEDAGVSGARNGIYDTGVGLKFDLRSEAETSLVIDFEELDKASRSELRFLSQIFSEDGLGESIDRIADESRARLAESGLTGGLLDVLA